MKYLKAEELSTGMIYWDDSAIEVLRKTKCFVFVNLITVCGKQVEVKWRKDSMISIGV